MKNLTLRNIARATGGEYFGDEALLDESVKGVDKDSREIKEGYLYIPFVGARVDGHDFIDDVFEKGALATLSEKELDIDKPYILVEDSGQALKDIAEFYREQLDCQIIGITGSVGKTSTKEIIASVLSEKFNVLKTEGNFNNEIGMPLTLLKIRDEHEIAVIEMGISFFDEMRRLSKVSKPDVCVITNIGTCHLENLNDRDGVLKAKTEMFENAKPNCLTVLNGDDDKLATIDEVNGREPIFYGLESNRDITATNIEPDGMQGTNCTIKYNDFEFDTYIPIPGLHMIHNALAATCIGVHYGMSLGEIDQGIRNLKAIGGRNNIFENKGITIIDDCYNANPMSMKASIDVLNNSYGRKVAILGDMFELGKDEAALHREVGEFINTKDIDLVICIGKLSKNIADAVTNAEVKYFETKNEFNPDKILTEGDTVLVKASNGMKFKEIVKKLSE